MFQLFLLIFLLISSPASAFIANICEEDGSPCLYPWQIQVDNGSLTDNGDGSADYSPAGGGGGGISNVVEDTTPQLGGNLDIQTHNIEGVDATEFGYLNGVTSSVQTQLDAKVTASSTNTLTNKTFDANATGNSLSNVDIADVTFDPILETEMDSLAEFDTQIGTTGTASSSTFLRGDNSWATPAGGGGGSGDMEASTYDPAAIEEQVVGLTATQTLTNKTLTSPSISGSATWSENKQTFNPGSTFAGINVGLLTSDPVVKAAGDIWYNSTDGRMKFQENGVTVTIPTTFRTILLYGFPSSNSVSGQELRPGSFIMDDFDARGYLMPYDGSVRSLSCMADIDTFTGASLSYLIRTDDTTTLVTVASGASGTGDDIRTETTYASGTHTFSAGEVLQIRRDFTGTVTTDDIVCSLEVELEG